MKKPLPNTQPRKESDTLSDRSFARIRDRAYRALMRAERGMPDAEKNLATLLNEVQELFSTNPSPELRKWIYAITPAATALLAESQGMENRIADRSVVN